jgi:TusE/DsrC/DsvC family sulfur relay protein
VELTMQMATEDRELLLALVEKVDAIGAKVDRMAQHHDALAEGLADVGPIGKAVMATATEKLGQFEERGYFAFGREVVGIADRIVDTYSPEDVRELAGSIVGILDTLRNLAQPDVLAIANEATDVLHDAESVAPVGPMGVLRASSDEDVQKGMAVLLEVLRHIGRATTAMNKGPARRVAAKPRIPGLKSSGRFKREPAPAAKAAPAKAPNIARTPAITLELEDVELDESGYMADPSAWSRDIALRIAAFEGVELTDAHWAVLEAARADFEATGKSPNVRRLTQVAGISTKELFTLFPKAPGRTVARVAGVSKPVGCI